MVTRQCQADPAILALHYKAMFQYTFGTFNIYVLLKLCRATRCEGSASGAQEVHLVAHYSFSCAFPIGISFACPLVVKSPIQPLREQGGIILPSSAGFNSMNEYAMPLAQHCVFRLTHCLHLGQQAGLLFPVKVLY